MQSASRFEATKAGSNVRRARLLASATFLMVSLAVGNWPASVHAQSFISTGTRAAPM